MRRGSVGFALLVLLDGLLSAVVADRYAALRERDRISQMAWEVVGIVEKAGPRRERR